MAHGWHIEKNLLVRRFGFKYNVCTYIFFRFLLYKYVVYKEELYAYLKFIWL